MIDRELEQEIREYARQCYPEEMCAFIVQGQLVPVKNIHENPTEFFKISTEDQDEYLDVCSHFIHSHPDWHPCPSEEDMRQQIATGVPWGIVGLDGTVCSKVIVFGDQVQPPPLLPEGGLPGRFFIHGITDCYSAIRDWYKIEKNILLKEIPRSWEWWKDSQDLYKDNFELVGFRQVNPEIIRQQGPQIGDVALACVGMGVKKLNHAGVYVGSGLLYHHLTAKEPFDMSRIAKREPVQKYYDYIKMWVRYDENNKVTR